MNPKKLFSPRYWARKVFALRPIRAGGHPVPTLVRGMIVLPENRGLGVLVDPRGPSILAELRQLVAWWITNYQIVKPEERGITVFPENRGIVA